jgi:hypothetical protein
MTRVLLAAAVLCAVAAACSSGAASQTPTQPRPQLGITGQRPIEVRGVGFEPSERVQVLLVTAGQQRWEQAVASSAGVFTVSFEVSLGSCARFTLRAFGSLGSSARFLPRRTGIACVTPDGGGSRT